MRSAWPTSQPDRRRAADRPSTGPLSRPVFTTGSQSTPASEAARDPRYSRDRPAAGSGSPGRPPVRDRNPSQTTGQHNRKRPSTSHCSFRSATPAGLPSPRIKIRETRAVSQPASRTRLPLGIQTFSEIRQENLYYVDKTHFACQLFRQGKHYFLSRPRRFGKSLFVSTLKELFEGRRDLFHGLAADDQWDWSVRRPVLILDLTNVNAEVEGNLEAELGDRLLDLEDYAGIKRRHATAPGRFRYLIRTLHKRSGRRVVLLVDEYDKPIIDALEQPDLATKNRNFLRSVYSVIKSCDQHLRFSFITGVSKFSKVSLFSSLNNLIDLTLEAPFSSLCGYTERDLDEVFAPELQGLDRHAIRRWYNGYSWGGDERVYNPYDLLLTLRTRKCKAWWFQTGTPKFLPDLLVRRNVSTLELEDLTADESLLSAFDIDEIATEALLFQTGYLTVTDWSEGDDGATEYRLDYPNREVRLSLNRALLSSLVNSLSKRLTHCRNVAKHIRAGDFEQLNQTLHAFFASIPHDWYRNSRIERYEGYYATVFFALLSGFGLDTRPEEASSRGNLDLAVSAPDRIVLFEFKTVDGRSGSGRALRQLKAKGYANQHLGSGKPVHLVGVEFSRETRNVARVEWETVGTAEAGSADASDAAAPD